ncbi:MAG: LOG family protein [Clostridia bacterium]|nr:LOG family protein [Clostridia bacterium]
MNIFICGGVSPKMKEKFLEGISDLAVFLAEHGHTITCVGSNTGAIGRMYNSFKEAGGQALLMVPDCYAAEAAGMKGQMVSMPNLYSMQQFALKNSKATIILPGGNGTLAELYMTLDNVKAGFDTDPIILFNINGFYDGFKLVEQGLVEAGVLNTSQNENVFVCKTPEEIMKIISKRNVKK